MNPDEWEKLRAAFEEISALPRDRRAQRLAGLDLEPRLLDRLKKMLAGDEQSDRFDFALNAEVRRLEEEIDTARQPGQPLGPYRLVRHLGDGGMGEVFLAERADGRFEAQVAIKFLALAGTRARALFERERHLLARVSHPNIARLIDAGEDDKSAWLVMEFVDGRPLTEYCETARANVEDRLELLRQAALAVDHAHQHFVVHRDLKPAHLLVDAEGTLKVLDFGIAAMLDPETGSASATASHGFTPLYAAPEQLLGEPATTAVDVYALGLVLYELISGRHAFGNESGATGDGSTTERKLSGRLEAIRNRAELGAFEHSWGGSRAWLRDLNAVIQTALARRPQERYRTPAEFAADLHRLAQGEPVLARKETRREAWGRWIRGHRLASGAIAVAVSSLLVGSAVAFWSASNAALQRDEALRQTQKAEMIAGFLQEVFRSVEPSRSPGKEVSAKDILDAGIKQLDTRSPQLPKGIAAELSVVFGDMLVELGEYQQGVDQYARALSLGEPDAMDRVGRMARLGQGRAYNSLGNFAASTEVLQGLASAPFDPKSFDDIDVKARLRLGYAYTQLGRLDEAEAVLDPLLASADLIRASGPDGREVLGHLEVARGTLYAARDDSHNELKMYSSGLKDLEAHFGTDLHPAVVNAIDNLANAYSRVGDNDKAREVSRRSLDLGARLYGESHPRQLIARMNFASSLIPDGENELGLAEIRGVLDTLAKDENHPTYAWEGVAWFNLGRAHENLRQFAEAETAMRKALALVTERLGEKSYRIGQYEASLGRIAWKQHRNGEARDLFLAGIASLRRAVGEDHQKTIESEIDYLVFLADAGMNAERDSLWSALQPRLSGYAADNSFVQISEVFAPRPGPGYAPALEQLDKYPRLTTMGYVTEVAHRLAATSR